MFSLKLINVLNIEWFYLKGFMTISWIGQFLHLKRPVLAVFWKFLKFEWVHKLFDNSNVYSNFE